MKNEMYMELESHLGDVLYAGWYGVTRQQGIGVETHSTKKVPTNEVIPMEILPDDNERYEKQGIRASDIIILWINNEAFIPVTFRWYNNLYNDGINETGGSNIGNWMYDHLHDYIRQRLIACGLI